MTHVLPRRRPSDRSRRNEKGPAGAEAPEGVVETAGDSDQLSRHGAVEVGPAEACGALQAAVLVEDNAFADQCDTGEEVGEPSIAVAIFCEVHHRRRSSDRQVTGNAKMLAHDVDELDRKSTRLNSSHQCASRMTS